MLQIIFSEPASACTVYATEAFRGPGRFFFEVSLPHKSSRTAIGWAASADSSAYLTPEFRPTASDASYVSFGGAGFVYPARRRGARGYGEGDTVRAELDLADGSAAGAVRFFVNGDAAGEALWRGGAAAFPAVSSEGGGVQCEVRGGALA
jgi:hypothetical protein